MFFCRPFVSLKLVCVISHHEHIKNRGKDSEVLSEQDCRSEPDGLELIFSHLFSSHRPVIMNVLLLCFDANTQL